MCVSRSKTHLEKMDDSEIIRQWSRIPRTFIEAYGDQGDFAHQTLLNPTLFSLLGEIQKKRILDAGCGTGYLARLLCQRGAHVIGLEPAKALFEYACQREKERPLGIEYIPADLTTWRNPEHRFDCIIANMVLMDISDYEAAVDTCFIHLRREGQLIVSLAHPCFEESDSEYQSKGYIAVKEYFQPYSIEQKWAYRFHRPLSQYINTLVQRGGVIQSIVEPRLNEEQVSSTPDKLRNVHVPGFIVIQVGKR